MASSDTVKKPLVGIVMGSASDWDTMKHCCSKLKSLGIPYEKQVLSAHRTPVEAHNYCTTAAERGLKVLIAAAGGAAHLAGVMAAGTTLPVIGVPMMGWSVNGLDALLATVNMPGGIPVNTVSIGKAGAINAALSAASIIALFDPEVHEALVAFRKAQTQSILETTLPDDE